MIDLSAELARILAPLRRRVSLMVRRAVISLVFDDNPVQTMQLRVFKNECREGVERLQEYGFSSVPLVDGQALVVCVDGECGHEVVVATDDRRYRPMKLEPGDVMLYTFANKRDGIDTEHHIVLRAKTRAVEVRGKNITLDADERILMKAGKEIVADTPMTRATGEVKDAVRTMSGDRELYNAHGHPDASPPPNPSQ